MMELLDAASDHAAELCPHRPALVGCCARHVEDTVRIHINTILAARDLADRHSPACPERS